MIPDDSIIVAILMIIGVTVSLTMTRLSTRLTVSLVGTILTLAVWSLLNLEPLDMWLSGWVPALSTLLKSWAVITIVILGNLFLDAMDQRFARPLRWALPAILVPWSIVAWLDVREVCADYTREPSHDFTYCSHRVGPYVFSEIAILLSTAFIVVALISVLWSMATLTTRVGHTMTLFFLVSVGTLMWLVLVTIGMAQIYQTGALADWVYTVRPPLAISTLVLNLCAVLYLPLRAGWDVMVFRRRAQPLTMALELKTTAPTISNGNLTTKTMDHLGLTLDEAGVAVANSSSRADAVATARWLAGSPTPPSGLPIDESLWEQRLWLLQVARMLN